MAERLQKILSQWGIASRRRAEAMIAQGQVRVNGAIATLGDKADPDCDHITVNGQPLQQPPQLLYLLLHKPLGVVSTCDDPQGRTTVLDVLPNAYCQNTGIHPVGRLDVNSTGALLLTNDGPLTHGLTHPRHHIAKTYEVEVQGHPTRAVLHQWAHGVALDGRKTLPAEVKILRPYRRDRDTTWLRIVLREGRNRQIRRVAEALGHPVRKLHRTHIDRLSLTLANGQPLPVGQYRPLSSSEIRTLRNIISINGPVDHEKEAPP